MRSLFRRKPNRNALDARIGFDEYKQLVKLFLPDAELQDGVGYWYLDLGKGLEPYIIQVQQFPRVAEAVQELYMWAMRREREQAWMKRRMEEPE